MRASPFLSAALLLCCPGLARASQCQPPTQDWSLFPGNLQCIVGVQNFTKAAWGAIMPATGLGQPNGGCAQYGACLEWVDNLPDGNVWNRHDWGSVPPQPYDVLIFPPVAGNPYGHAAMLDHVDGAGTLWVMDDNWDGHMGRSCSWGGHDGWVHNGVWTPYGFFRLKSKEPPPPDKAPEGFLDGADCSQIHGWARDPDDNGAQITVHVMFDGQDGSAPHVDLAANQHRDDLCSAIGSCDHAYALSTPRGLMDGKPHQIFASADDSHQGSPGADLMGSPKSITCAPPDLPFSPAEKRHVVSPDSLSAWKLSMLSDVVPVPQAKVDAIPTAKDAPAAPKLAKGDDGSPEVWLLDGAYRRHVTSAASMAAWRFDAGAVVTTPAAQLQAIPAGLPWPDAPFALLAPSGEVYLLDALPKLPPASGPGAGGGAGAPGKGGAGASGAPAQGGPGAGAAGAASGSGGRQASAGAGASSGSADSGGASGDGAAPSDSNGASCAVGEPGGGRLRTWLLLALAPAMLWRRMRPGARAARAKTRGRRAER